MVRFKAWFELVMKMNAKLFYWLLVGSFVTNVVVCILYLYVAIFRLLDVQVGFIIIVIVIGKNEGNNITGVVKLVKKINDAFCYTCLWIGYRMWAMSSSSMV